MAEKKERNKMFTTPKGIAAYPWLTKPDTKFKQAGEFSIRLKVPADEATGLVKLIEEAREANFAAVKADNPKKSIKKADPPCKPELDDEGNETGNLLFNFKQGAIIKTKDGETIKVTIKIFDAKGRPIVGKIVGAGSTVKVAFQLNPFYTAQIGAGISLRLKAVQVIDLIEPQGGSASSYGFGEEDGGYEFDGEDVAFDGQAPPAGSPANGDF
jgi:hypothetical protein